MKKLYKNFILCVFVIYFLAFQIETIHHLAEK